MHVSPADDEWVACVARFASPPPHAAARAADDGFMSVIQAGALGEDADLDLDEFLSLAAFSPSVASRTPGLLHCGVGYGPATSSRAPARSCAALRPALTPRRVLTCAGCLTRSLSAEPCSQTGCWSWRCSCRRRGERCAAAWRDVAQRHASRNLCGAHPRAWRRAPQIELLKLHAAAASDLTSERPEKGRKRRGRGDKTAGGGIAGGAPASKARRGGTTSADGASPRQECGSAAETTSATRDACAPAPTAESNSGKPPHTPASPLVAPTCGAPMRSRGIKLRGPNVPSEGLKSAVARFLHSCQPAGEAQQQFFGVATTGSSKLPTLRSAAAHEQHQLGSVERLACRPQLAVDGHATTDGCVRCVSDAAALPLPRVLTLPSHRRSMTSHCTATRDIADSAVDGTERPPTSAVGPWTTALLGDDPVGALFEGLGCAPQPDAAALAFEPCALQVDDSAEWFLREALLHLLDAGTGTAAA